MKYIYQEEDILFHHSRDETPDANNFPMHAHDRFELYYFISGAGTYSVEGNEYNLLPGCILLMRPGETHKPQIMPREPYERMALHFYPELLDGIDPEHHLLSPFLNRPGGRQNLYTSLQGNTHLLQSCFEAMTRPLSPNRYDQRLAVCANFPTILHEISMVFEAQKTNILQTPQSLIGSVVDFINTNITTDLNLDMLSARFYISKSYLNQQFRQATGTTIWDYILPKRLMLARSAIRSGIAVTEALRSSGFKDYSSFYRRYKDRFGVSPKEDRP